MLVNSVKGCTKSHFEHHQEQKISIRQNGSNDKPTPHRFPTKAREGWPRLDRASASSCLIFIWSPVCPVLRGLTCETCQAEVVLHEPACRLAQFWLPLQRLHIFCVSTFSANSLIGPETALIKRARTKRYRDPFSFAPLNPKAPKPELSGSCCPMARRGAERQGCAALEGNKHDIVIIIRTHEAAQKLNDLVVALIRWDPRMASRRCSLSACRISAPCLWPLLPLLPGLGFHACIGSPVETVSRI